MAFNYSYRIVLNLTSLMFNLRFIDAAKLQIYGIEGDFNNQTQMDMW